ncbi:hypothetical protein VNPA120661_11940 [Pseudomonas aeruginosa]|jgi:hypothetical protein|uniref:Uncharacterized protein n=2 Tax=Pseudomonas TaxID=286 RepID=A0A223Q3C9_PSEPU|nr:MULTISPECIES: hypothetical protein [Pseudomonas]AVX92595.1 hypothetical protein PkP19E3_30895 [Pseudomonas koreensis]ERV73188.1 hypothetical protein Q041_06430 [Pseudomonas aeruginosa BWHPSA028]ASU52140.1 Hypothetical protein [Pseudomonas putida]AVE20335.1 Hypothetical protein [Pseudomonas aeruginosa]AVE20866.1 Hypothetical protein [Pseudomonas aeruginosa]
MRKTAYHLGVFAFGMLSVGQMVPVLLGDESLGNWQFAGLTLTVLLTIGCSYKASASKDVVES